MYEKNHFWVGLLGVVVISLIYLPFCCYCIYKFSKNLHQAYIIHRCPEMVYVVVVSFVSALVLYNPVEFISIALNMPKLLDNQFMVILYQFQATTAGISIMFKYWLVVFKYKHQHAIVEQKWKQILNPQSSSFWIKYKSTFGNIGWLKWVIIGLMSSTLIIQTVLTLDGYDAASISNGLSFYTFLWFVDIVWITFNVIFVITIVLYIGINKKFRDLYYIRREVIIMCFVFMAVFIVYIICDIINGMFFNNKSMILFFLTLISYPTSVIIIVYFQMLYPLQKNLNNHERSNYKHKGTSINTNSKSSTSTSNTTNTRDNINGIRSEVSQSHVFQDDWPKLISTESGFKFFMSHLVKSFNTENLLFIVEVMQWKNNLISKIDEIIIVNKMNQQTKADTGTHQTTPNKAGLKLGQRLQLHNTTAIANEQNSKQQHLELTAVPLSSYSDDEQDEEDINSDTKLKNKREQRQQRQQNRENARLKKEHKDIQDDSNSKKTHDFGYTVSFWDKIDKSIIITSSNDHFNHIIINDNNEHAKYSNINISSSSSSNNLGSHISNNINGNIKYNQCLNQANELYLKYIKPNFAPFEINIGATDRNRLCKFFEKGNRNQTFAVDDPISIVNDKMDIDRNDGVHVNDHGDDDDVIINRMLRLLKIFDETLREIHFMLSAIFRNFADSDEYESFVSCE